MPDAFVAFVSLPYLPSRWQDMIVRHLEEYAVLER